jgi:Protein of unknown function (DUF1566)
MKVGYLSLALIVMLAACDDDDVSFGAGEDLGSDGTANSARLVKMDSAGNLLDSNASQWSCVLDSDTALVWSVKTDDGALHDKDGYYTWFNDDSNTNQGAAGVAGGFSSCTGNIQCDTQTYIAATNAQGLCGNTSWRLPSADELQQLAQEGANPTSETEFFVLINFDSYWSNTLANSIQRMTFSFSTQQLIPENHDNLNPVILVRSQ